MKNIKSGTALSLVLAAAIQVAPLSFDGGAYAESRTPPVRTANASTGIDITPGGTPVVNIATPRADGTSYNVFDQLNVGKEGLIFNNSPAIGASAIGGQILPNANLVRGGKSAGLILNEVTGGTRSSLAGAIEVFGSRAALVIANPSGITCDGCGFINISRVALSSGRIAFGADGAFTGFQVDGGDVSVIGNGLFAGNVDYFDIVTASASINAKLYANDLVVAGGNSDYDYAARTAKARDGVKGAFAIDSSRLGGVYVNRIRLIGTSAGMGVNLQGTVAALNGPVSISADGRIGIADLASATNIDVRSVSGDIDISGPVYAGGGSATLEAGGAIRQSGGLIGAAGDLSLKAGADLLLAGPGLYAGLNSAGQLDRPAAISLVAGANILVGATQLASLDRIDLTGGSITLEKDSALSSRNIGIASGSALILEGAVTSNQSVVLGATGQANIGGSIGAVENLSLTAGGAKIRGAVSVGGALTAAVAGDVAIGKSATVIADRQFAVSAANLHIAGTVDAIGGVSAQLTDQLSVASTGALRSGNTLLLDLGTFGNDGLVSSAGLVDVKTRGALANSGQIISSDGMLRIAAAGDLGVSATGIVYGIAKATPKPTTDTPDPKAKTGDVIKNLFNVDISFGISKSSSTSTTIDQRVVGSSISGGDVAVIARGAGAASTISVTGSTISAGRDLTLAAPGAITLKSAIETDTATAKNKSSGFSAGISIGAGGITPSASVNLAKGNSSGTDVRHVESVLSAGGTATVVTPGALTLQGATLSASSVKLNVGSLTITSEQDTSAFASKAKSIGASLSLSPSSQLSGGINLGSTKQTGSFASVAEQSGVFAGKGGFDIRVSGATTLTGAVIASAAPSALNSLQTGTLSATDLHNQERYNATSTSIGIGLGANLSKDAKGQINTNGTGQPLPDIKTGLGTLSATPPVALSASGKQAGETLSAIAPGSIVIASGDAAGLNTAATISRDPASANTGALTQAFTEAKRAEIAQGFEAVRLLTNETATFFANRAGEEAAKRKEAKAAEARGDKVAAATLTLEADRLRDTYGAGSPIRIIATALSGAAGSNVTGSLGSLVQGAAVNVLQSLGATQVKALADGLFDKNGNPTAQSETVRAALQAVVGCAGSAAGGSGSCTAAATGAAASVALNALLTATTDPKPASGQPRTLEDQQARTNLVATLVTAIATGAGLDVRAATTAAIVETENNANYVGTTKGGKSVSAIFSPNGNISFDDYLKTAQGKAFLSLFGGTAQEKERKAREFGFATEAELAAFGGKDGLVAFLNTPGNSLAGYRAFESAKQNAFQSVTKTLSLADINRYANDPAAFAKLSPGNQQQLRLAYAYAQDNPLTALLVANATIGSGLSFLDSNYQLTTRGLGLVQGVGGVFGGIASGAGVAVGAAACAPTAGGGCLLAGVSALGFAASVDQAQAGVRTLFNGRDDNRTLGGLGIEKAFAITPQNAELVYGLGTIPLTLGSGGTSIAGSGRAIITRANGEVAKAFDNATVYEALRRSADEAATGHIPSVTFNQIAGSHFEHDVLTALGATKNTLGTPVVLKDGTIATTIFDATGRNVGGLLEIKNVEQLNFTKQLQAQVQFATEHNIPLNIVVSPTTTRVTKALMDAVKDTGPLGQKGGVFVFDPVTGLITRY